MRNARTGGGGGGNFFLLLIKIKISASEEIVLILHYICINGKKIKINESQKNLLKGCFN